MTVETAQMEGLDSVLERHSRDESQLIPLLQDIQEQMGYICSEAIEAAARHLNIPESSVYGVVTFYSQFYLTPRGRNTIKICQGTACHVRGATKLASAVHKKIGIKPGETSKDGEFSIERVACIGSCALAPAVIGNNKIHGPMTSQGIDDLIDRIREAQGLEAEHDHAQ